MAVRSVRASSPFDAGPQFAPQGLFGDTFGRLAGPIWHAIGGQFGKVMPGSASRSAICGQIGQRFIPFDAASASSPHRASSATCVGQVGATDGNAIGGRLW